MKINNYLNNKLLYITCIIILSPLFTIYAGVWPEIYIFATDSSQSITRRLWEAPIHLSDDVMISMRSGQIFNEIGFPAFNRIDMAQPSTSYLSPYLFSVLLKLMPENIALLSYALLGLLSVCFTFILIAYVAKSKINAALIIAVLSLTTTNISYSLNGWDHLFQTLFLILAFVIMFKPKVEKFSLISLSTCLAFAVLFRPDGLLIAATMLVATILNSSDKRKAFLFSVFPFVLIIGYALIYNFNQFGFFTPTTARLKIGASPSLEYSLIYFFKNILLFSAITVLLAFIFLYIRFRKNLFDNIDSIIVLGCLASSAVSFYNSDAFSAGRVVLAPTCVMAILIATKLPSIIKIDPSNFSEQQFFNSPDYPSKLILALQKIFLKSNFGIFILIIMILTFLFLAKQKGSDKVISYENFYKSPTAQQFFISKWIEKNLQPKDGVIGFFYLGVSYHIPKFEIADFLGKADEVIAVSSVKWGPPGHNKWDINQTLNKWNLQAIVPAGNSDKNHINVLDNARLAIQNKQDFGFHPDLLLNQTINETFSYCYILKKNKEKLEDRWGFYVRKDIALKHRDGLLCN